MAIDKDQVKHIADLAKLDFRSPDELDFFAGRLESILEFAKILESVDTDNVEPTNQVTGLINVFRDDVVEDYPDDKRQKMFSQVPVFKDGYVVVPHAIKRLK